MEHPRNGTTVMTASNPFGGHALGDCLRAAQADADRFHGARAPDPWREARPRRGLVLAAGLTLLATVAAGLLALSPAEAQRPPVTLAAARTAPGQWFTPAPDEGVDDAPPASTSASAPVPGRPPALADASTPLTLDGGDVDIAASMPASVLTATDTNEAPRVAPMNVPTPPDPHDGTTGEPEPAAVTPAAG